MPHNSTAMVATPKVDFELSLMVSINSYVMILVGPVYNTVSVDGTLLQISNHWNFSCGVTTSLWCMINGHKALHYSRTISVLCAQPLS
jgi:hypothetical protein